jgi:hypothetical protein
LKRQQLYRKTIEIAKRVEVVGKATGCTASQRHKNTLATADMATKAAHTHTRQFETAANASFDSSFCIECKRGRYLRLVMQVNFFQCSICDNSALSGLQSSTKSAAPLTKSSRELKVEPNVRCHPHIVRICMLAIPAVHSVSMFSAPQIVYEP